MCGIFGVIVPTGYRPDRGLLKAATNSMFNRGPDSSGYAVHERVGFGARRLAILDVENGEQPIVSKCGRVAAMQNGEIYNYQDLRKTLIALGHPIQTHCDTEILVYGYLEWGIDGLLSRIDGMFALAIHDRHNRVVHIARDRFGEKPLYFHRTSETLVFSSQLLTVARWPEVPFSLSSRGIEAYFALHFVPGDECILDGIHKVLPGQVLSWSLGSNSLQLRRYWQLSPKSIPAHFDRRELAFELRDRVKAAVKSRLISDVPIGAFLSGGIDSSIVVACMAEHVRDLKTFSVGFERNELDESPYAKLVAEHFGSDHHHLTFGLSDFEALLPNVVSTIDEPIGDQACLPAFWLSKLAQQHVRVVLSGEGADEIFGGYSYYQPRSLPNDWRKDAYRVLRPFAKQASQGQAFLNDNGTTPSGYPLVFSGDILRTVVRQHDVFEHSPWCRSFRDDLLRFEDPLQAACYADMSTWLPDDLLVKLDRMGMAVSLEGRCPYLEPSLVEFALSLPQELKIGVHNSKVILRDAFRDILTRNILSRPKQGFLLPLQDFFSGVGKDMLLDVLSVGIDDGVIRNGRLRDLVENWLKQPVLPVRHLLTLLIYRLWLIQAYRQPKFGALSLS